MSEMGEVMREAFFAGREMFGSRRRGSDRFGSFGGGGGSVPETAFGGDRSEGSRGLEEERRGTGQVRNEVVDENIIAVEDWENSFVSTQLGKQRIERRTKNSPPST